MNRFLWTIACLFLVVFAIARTTMSAEFASTPVVGCALPAIDSARVEVAKATVTAAPTPPADLVSYGNSANLHIMEFPPLKWDQLTEQQERDVRRFLSGLSECISIGQYDALYGTYSVGYLVRLEYALGPGVLDELIASPVVPSPEASSPPQDENIALLRAWITGQERYIVALVEFAPAGTILALLLAEPNPGAFLVEDSWMVSRDSLLLTDNVWGPVYSTPRALPATPVAAH